MRFKRVLITGSNGLLGQKLVKLLSRQPGVEVLGLSRGPIRIKAPQSYTYNSIDLLDHEQLKAQVDAFKPEAIVHTAAMTNVDACELNKTTCDAVNVDLVKYLVELCAERDLYLIHLSNQH